MAAGGFEQIRDLVGESAPMRALRRRIAEVAPVHSTLLLTGETGVGKGVVARAIHRLSRRHRGPFVHVDCAALSPSVVESELFGHERGAFTGAVAKRPGRFDLAGDGTIFLDEVGELPAALQPKLLRVLQDREYERLGGVQTLGMTARVVAATTRNLLNEVRLGRFRADLYYRLDVVRLRIPPLRERTEDIPVLLATAFERLAKGLDLVPPTLGDSCFARLAAHCWPGNVRELLNVVERLLIRWPGRRIDAANLDGILDDERSPLHVPVAITPLAGRSPQSLLESVDPSDRIASELQATGGNVARAARQLGLPRSTLRHWIRRYGIG